MCCRFTLIAPNDIMGFFGVGEPFDAPPRYNIAPTQQIIALRVNPDHGRPEWVQFRWGLIPAWAKDLSIGARTINARCETLFEKPAFRGAARKRRCVIPASGFYEWKKEGAVKQPYYLQAASGEPLAFAGLWEIWTGPDEIVVESCTLITTQANRDVQKLHDRMPAILTRQNIDAWLDPAQSDQENLKSLLAPAPDDWLTVTPVGRRVNNARLDSPECLQPESQDPLFEL
ncbi:MAG: hypothetical protein GC154_17995 [bacterium]|nr:hypothetical protein [bacterium]